MANFRIITDSVSAHALALDALDGQLQEAASRLASIANAAAGTSAQDALSDAAKAWEGAIGAYAGVVGGLADAATLAAQCYAVTDATLVGRG